MCPGIRRGGKQILQKGPLEHHGHMRSGPPPTWMPGARYTWHAKQLPVPLSNVISGIHDDLLVDLHAIFEGPPHTFCYLGILGIMGPVHMVCISEESDARIGHSLSKDSALPSVGRNRNYSS